MASDRQRAVAGGTPNRRREKRRCLARRSRWKAPAERSRDRAHCSRRADRRASRLRGVHPESRQDKLSGNQVGSTNASDPEKRCAAQATYDLIKRELFRRAAQVRGSDQASYDRLSAYAVLRMENPVMESQDKDTGAINCSGSLRWTSRRELQWSAGAAT